jgi:hypothetical protein
MFTARNKPSWIGLEKSQLGLARASIFLSELGLSLTKLGSSRLVWSFNHHVKNQLNKNFIQSLQSKNYLRNNDLKLPSCKKLRKYLINYIINDFLEINRNTLNLYINKGTGEYFLIITIKDCFSSISSNVIN